MPIVWKSGGLNHLDPSRPVESSIWMALPVPILLQVLLRVSEQRNILHEIRKRKANWIGHILGRNCLLKQVIEGKIKGEREVTRRVEEDVGNYWMTLRTGEDTLI